MDSIPPATTTSASPRAMAWAPEMTALRPEPQTLLSVQHGTFSGSPAKRAAWRAGAWPTPACRTFPITTSSTADGETPDRSRAARIAVAPSRGAGTADSEPMKEPMGVRAAPTITTSRRAMEFLSGRGSR